MNKLYQVALCLIDFAVLVAGIYFLFTGFGEQDVYRIGFGAVCCVAGGMMTAEIVNEC